MTEILLVFVSLSICIFVYLYLCLFVSLSICCIILHSFAYVSAKFVAQLYKVSFVLEWEGLITYWSGKVFYGVELY